VPADGLLQPSAEAAPLDSEPHAAGSARASIYSPVVSRLAAEHDIDLKTIKGTGRDGRVRKQDVLAAIESNGRAQESPYEPPAPVSLSRLRQAIGENTKRSLDTAATVTSWIEVDFSRVELVRKQLGTTALPVVASATVATLADFPDLNAWLDVHDYIRHETVNLGIAVAIGAAGVLVPVIREAERLSVTELARRIRDLATRARNGELVPDDMRDGTFTLTNPGQFGTMMATPVIIQPQVAILDVEAIVRRPTVVVEPSGEERIAIHPMCVLGMSWDHRALDGVLAAQFLGALRARLESLESPG
jgi:2-oxoglutarate dehydrogenase E2 component (dihydrolipoamide succinyltransferase)